MTNQKERHSGAHTSKPRLARASKKPARHRQHLSELSRMGRTVVASLDPNEVLKQVIEQVLVILGAQDVSILLREGDELVFGAVTGASADVLRGKRMPLYAGVAGEVMKTGESRVVSGETARAKVYREIDKISGYQTQSLLAVPLKMGDSVIGVMEAAHQKPNAFDRADLELLEATASWAAVAIGNAQLFNVVQRGKREWEQTVDVIAEGISLVDDQYRLQRVNRTLANWVHLPMDALVGKLCYQVIDGCDTPPAHCPHAQLMQAREQFREVELELARLAGTFRFSSYALRDAGGNFTGTVNVLKDVTAEKRMQAQLIQAEKMAATGRLAASIAHEINNPLQAIQGCLDLSYANLADAEKQTRYLTMAKTEVERLTTIVQRMLDFYKPGKGDRALLDTRALVEDVLALSAKRMQHARIAVQIKWDDGLPVIEGAANQLKQVFLNLILNAIEALPRGGTLRIAGNARTDAGKEWLTVAFSDSGEGISPDTLDKIFEPFYTTKSDGTGLGLAVSHGIVANHGGRLTVTSQPGKGSTFVVWLPMAEKI